MFNIDFTFLWTLINLLVLYFVLRKLLFGRIGAMMKKRSDSIAASIQQGEEARADGEAYKKQCQELIAKTDSERKTILDETRQRSQAEFDAIVSDAKREAAAILTNARAEIVRERNEMMAELEGRIATLAILAASRVVEANMDNEANVKLVEKFLKDEGAA